MGDAGAIRTLNTIGSLRSSGTSSLFPPARSAVLVLVTFACLSADRAIVEIPVPITQIVVRVHQLHLDPMPLAVTLEVIWGVAQGVIVPIRCQDVLRRLPQAIRIHIRRAACCCCILPHLHLLQSNCHGRAAENNRQPARVDRIDRDPLRLGQVVIHGAQRDPS